MLLRTAVRGNARRAGRKNSSCSSPCFFFVDTGLGFGRSIGEEETSALGKLPPLTDEPTFCVDPIGSQFRTS